MRALRTVVFAPLAACLLGVDNTVPEPSLAGDPVVVSPSPGPDGVIRARAGTEVVLEVRTRTVVDLDGSAWSIGGLALDCEAVEADAPTYRCAGVPEGTESEGPARLNADLTDGRVTRTDASAPCCTSQAARRPTTSNSGCCCAKSGSPPAPRRSAPPAPARRRASPAPRW